MKLNQEQKYALALWLGEKVKGLWRNVGIIREYDKFCNEDPQYYEWRIIHNFGMAGKIWNVQDAIYITGKSPNELSCSKPEYKYQQEIVEKWNEEIKTILMENA